MKPITVSEFIEILGNFKSESFVFIDGYEWGIGRLTAEGVRAVVAFNEKTDETLSAVYISRICGSPDQGSFGMDFEVKE